ncbi:hypothetical protein NA57DRAFT_56645 [Rhizodiscina lignyota]|uniref:BTB domain-containing protein n=1 Tax=Rhizodiscina lignyota TaxID=1504668 RepID=A0A9P4IIZ3_9PEZI|nr:hypothetical protein NA57DRAFT_56645 [Rhizodiscina lignyota]
MQDIEIAPEGDVILIVGDVESENACRLRVQSVVLCAASPVFERMLTSGFSESIGLDSSNPKEIPLPGDNPDIVQLFCKIAHFKNTDVPHCPSADMFLDFAVFVDKYGCQATMSLVITLWSAHVKELHMVDDYTLLVEAKDYQDDPDNYKRLSNLFMLNVNPSKPPREPKYEMDPRIFEKMTNMASEARSNLRQAIEDAILDVPATTEERTKILQEHFCNVCATVNPGLPFGLRFLAAAGLWPIYQLPSTVGGILERMQALDGIDSDDDDVEDCCLLRKHLTEGWRKADILGAADRARSTCAGLCLDCERAGGYREDCPGRVHHG